MIEADDPRQDGEGPAGQGREPVPADPASAAAEALSTGLPAPLVELVPEDTPADELDRLVKVDALLRRTPAPASAVSDTLTTRVAHIPERPQERGRRPGRERGAPRRWLGYAAALAACGAAFAIGFFVRGGGEEQTVPADVVTLNATPRGPGGATMLIEVVARDQAGNWALLADVSGLEPLASGQYYELWLTQNRRVAVSCGRFAVDANGTAVDVWMNAPYRFRDYDDWVVTREGPGKERSPWLLRGPISTPV